MKLSRSTGYAIAALGYIAQNTKEGPVVAKLIAEQRQIPLEYLLKILQQLVRAGLAQGIRGPQGGFRLRRDAGDITLLDIIEALEGPFVAEPDLQQGPVPFQRRVNKTYLRAAREAAGVLAKTSLMDLIVR